MVQGFFEYLTHDNVHRSLKDVSDTQFQCLMSSELPFLQMLSLVFSVQCNPWQSVIYLADSVKPLNAFSHS
jgi:hypothetical protein